MKEVARLIVDSNGTEKVVFSPTFVPETPEEQKIVFPDKKEFVVDWRRNFEVITELGNVIKSAEIVQEEGTFNVPFTHPEIPYAIGFNFSDAHIGSHSSDHNLIKNFLELVLETPNSFLVDTGDTFDNGIWGGLHYEQSLPPYMQTFTVEDIMRELGDKYAACVIGNHPEWLFSASGLKPEVLFAQRMKGPVFPGIGLLHLVVGEQKYDWALSHTYWGRSRLNIFNVCRRLRENEYPNADIFSVGHDHVWGYMKEKIDGREVLYIRPGTAKIDDRYAKIHGIARRGQAFGIAVIFGAKNREFNAYSLSDAVDLMRIRKELASLHS